LQEHEEEGADHPKRDDHENDEDSGFEPADGGGDHSSSGCTMTSASEISSSTQVARRVPVAGVLVILAGGTFLHLARQRGVPVSDSLWAEDGEVFLSDALRDFPGTLFAQNGGYCHLVPRLIAGAAAVLPIGDAAVGMAAAAAFVLTLVAGFVFLASAEIMRSRIARLGLACAVLLLPVPGEELLANATNLHFYLLFACFWALVWQSETPAALVSRLVVAITVPLSDPLAVLFAPLAVVAPVVRRTRRALAVSCVFFASVAAQLLLMLGGDRPGRNWAFRLTDLPDVFSLRVAGGLLTGDRFLGDAWIAYGRAFSYGALIVVAAVIASLMLRGDRRTVAFSLLSLAYGGLFFCVQLVARGTSGIAPDPDTFHLNHARYVVLPFLFTVTVILALTDRISAHRANAAWKWGRRGVLLWLAALLVVNYSVTGDRSRGPRWDRQLIQARAACAATVKRTASVLVAPSPPRVWFATVPCRRLDQPRR